MSRVTAQVVVDTLVLLRSLLADHRSRLDDMNVFPIADGDTGTNLLGTIDEIAAALTKGAVDDDLGEVASLVGETSVRAARGNSGIIVAEALRGFTAALVEGGPPPGAAAGGPRARLASALAEASRQARLAVSDPVEGTVLTVAADAASAAGAVPAGADDLAVARAAADEAWASLARTPTLLPPLAEAGVVDAGGAGYALLLDALVAALGGPRPDRAPPAPRPGDASAGRPARPAGVVGPQYELLVDLVAEPAAVDQLRREWARSGESLVVVGHADRWRAHLHTDQPESARAVAERLGTVSRAEITDLHRQAARHLAASPLARPPLRDAVSSVVAVAATDQLAHLLSELGAAVIVRGGRGNRPRGGAILDAIAAAATDEVVVLPDDGPTVDVARRAAARSVRHAAVVPAASAVEGLVAMDAYDPRAPAERVAATMTRAIERVSWCEILPVVRASRVQGIDVVAGDWLVRGHRPSFLEVAGDPFDGAVVGLDRLVDRIDGGTGDLLETVIVLWGAAGDAEEAAMLRDHVESLYSSAIVEVHVTAEPHLAYAVAARRRS